MNNIMFQTTLTPIETPTSTLDRSSVCRTRRFDRRQVKGPQSFVVTFGFPLNGSHRNTIVSLPWRLDDSRPWHLSFGRDQESDPQRRERSVIVKNMVQEKYVLHRFVYIVCEGTILDFHYCSNKVEYESVRQWLDPVRQEGSTFLVHWEWTCSPETPDIMKIKKKEENDKLQTDRVWTDCRNPKFWSKQL